MSSPALTEAIPVYLLTGFLGSGKTTLLRRLIHLPAFSNTAVIVNEFGEIGLDHVLLEKSNDTDVALLASGCLCCATSSPLQDSLEDLYYQRLRGEIPAFARAVVETSGLADPAPLINSLTSDPSVARHYRFAGVITTLDAVYGAQTLASYAEARTQLVLADRVVLTKIDLVTDDQRRATKALIQEYNPYADIQPSSLSDDGDILSGLPGSLISQDPELQIIADSNLSAKAPRAMPFAHLLRYGIASHTFRITEPVSWEQYAAWVEIVQRRFGEHLLRAKGILKFADGIDYAIHGVHHLFSPPQPLNVPIPTSQLGALVVIVKDTPREIFETTLSVLSGRQPSIAQTD